MVLFDPHIKMFLSVRGWEIPRKLDFLCLTKVLIFPVGISLEDASPRVKWVPWRDLRVVTTWVRTGTTSGSLCLREGRRPSLVERPSSGETPTVRKGPTVLLRPRLYFVRTYNSCKKYCCYYLLLLPNVYQIFITTIRLDRKYITRNSLIFPR